MLFLESLDEDVLFPLAVGAGAGDGAEAARLDPGRAASATGSGRDVIPIHSERNEREQVRSVGRSSRETDSQIAYKNKNGARPVDSPRGSTELGDLGD